MNCSASNVRTKYEKGLRTTHFPILPGLVTHLHSETDLPGYARVITDKSTHWRRNSGGPRGGRPP